MFTAVYRRTPRLNQRFSPGCSTVNGKSPNYLMLTRACPQGKSIETVVVFVPCCFSVPKFSFVVPAPAEDRRKKSLMQLCMDWRFLNIAGVQYSFIYSPPHKTEKDRLQPTAILSDILHLDLPRNKHQIWFHEEVALRVRPTQRAKDFHSFPVWLIVCL